MLWPELVKWLPELEEYLPTFSADPDFLDPDLLDHVGRYVSVRSLLSSQLLYHELIRFWGSRRSSEAMIFLG